MYAKTVAQTFDAAKGGQLTQLAVTDDYTADYFYNAATGRLERVAGPGLPAGTGTPGAHYGYVAGSDLVAGVSFKNSAGAELLGGVRAFESNRDFVATVTHTWPQGTPTTVSLYDYRAPANPSVAADELGRRTNAAYSGVAFGSPTPPIAQPFGYNDRNELISSSRGTASWGYLYDPIGNRKTYTTAGPVVTTYTSNFDFRTFGRGPHRPL